VTTIETLCLLLALYLNSLFQITDLIQGAVPFDPNLQIRFFFSKVCFFYSPSFFPLKLNFGVSFNQIPNPIPQFLPSILVNFSWVSFSACEWMESWQL